MELLAGLGEQRVGQCRHEVREGACGLAGQGDEMSLKRLLTP